MPSRRPHTNSHHGCVQCKTKRVKCDQGQPACNRCVKKGSECTYRHLLSSYNPFQHTVPGPSGPVPNPATHPDAAQDTTRSTRASTKEPAAKSKLRWQSPVKLEETTPSSLVLVSTPPAVRVAQFPTTAMQMQLYSVAPPASRSVSPRNQTKEDEYLMTHFAENLSVPTMSPILESEFAPTLYESIIRWSQSIDYVYSVTLSFSAFHLASIQASGQAESSPYFTPDAPFKSNLLSVAIAHKDTAITLFREELAKGITHDNGGPLLTCSAVLVACALALPVADPGRVTQYDRIDLLGDVAILFNGTTAIFKQGIFGPYPREAPNHTTVDGQLSPGDGVPWAEAEVSLSRVVSAIEALPADPPSSSPTSPEVAERRAVLQHAASRLRQCFHLVATAKKDFHTACMWLGLVRPVFGAMIKARDRLALALLAHWIVCRSHMDKIWWARGWPAESMAAVLEEMAGSEEASLLSFCAGRVGMQIS